MSTMIIVGGQFGDEGKGKIVAYLALTDKPGIAARAGVGPNAGHTVTTKKEEYGLRLTPSGFIYDKARLLIGAGVLIDPEIMIDEIDRLRISDRIGIDHRCTIIEMKHQEEDRGSKHLSKRIGTTGSGCGPANAERALRKIKQAKDVEELKPYLTDVPEEIHAALDEGKDVLVEGSQGFGLSLIWGTYPYVTSKDTTASTFAADVGLGPKNVDEVLLVVKAFPTRVGSGPFKTEISQKKAEELGIVEYGTVTGRRRRIGTFDYDMVRQGIKINSATQLAITGIDKLDAGCRSVAEWDALTEKAKNFIKEVEERLALPVTIISTGPKINEIIDLRHEKL